MSQAPDSEGARRLSAVHAAPAALGIVVLIVALAMRRLGDPDLPWHLATGQSIWAHKGIPDLDDLAFTHSPVHYTVAASDLLFFGVERLAGLLGLQIFGALIAAATAIVLFVHARRSGPIAYLVLALAVASLNAWLFVSTSELSFLLLAATLCLIDVHRRSPASRAGKLALFALAPLQLFWANAHGFAAVGAAICALYLGYRVASRLARGRVGDFLPIEDGVSLGPAACAVGLAIAATALNTGGPRLLLGTQRFGEDLRGITEWVPTTFGFLFERQPMTLVIFALGVVALIFGREDREGRVRRVPSLFECGLVLGTIVLTALALRMIPVATLVIAPIAASRLAWLVPKTKLMQLTCAAATLAAGAFMLLTPMTSVGVGFEPKIFPVAATRFIEAAKPQGRMWNFWPFGGYLAWQLGPAYPVFMDGRNALAREPSLVTRANQSLIEPSAFDALAREFDMQWAITNASANDPFSGAPLAKSGDWAMVYLDDVAAVYVRQGAQNRALAREGYRVLRHATSPDQALQFAMSSDVRARELMGDGALAARQDPASARSAFFEVCGAIAGRNRVMFESAIERFARLTDQESVVSALVTAWKERVGDS